MHVNNNMTKLDCKWVVLVFSTLCSPEKRRFWIGRWLRYMRTFANTKSVWLKVTVYMCSPKTTDVCFALYKGDVYRWICDGPRPSPHSCIVHKWYCSSWRWWQQLASFGFASSWGKNFDCWFCVKATNPCAFLWPHCKETTAKLTLGVCAVIHGRAKDETLVFPAWWLSRFQQHNQIHNEGQLFCSQFESCQAAHLPAFAPH